MIGKERTSFTALFVTGAMLLPLDAGAVLAQAVPSAVSAPAHTPSEEERMPIDPATSRPFPTLEELIARTPPLREMTAKEETDFGNLLDRYTAASQAQKTDEAIDILRMILASSESFFGPEHPITYSVLVMLELPLRLARKSEAEPVAKRTWQIAASVFGNLHPQTLTSLNNYASVLLKLGRASEAEPLVAESLRLRSEVLGERHPDTLASLNSYANVVFDLGRANEAERLFSEALRLRRVVLGDQHFASLQSLSDYARVLHERGHLSEAETLSAEALRLYTEVRGASHPDTLTSPDYSPAVA